MLAIAAADGQLPQSLTLGVVELDHPPEVGGNRGGRQLATGTVACALPALPVTISVLVGAMGRLRRPFGRNVLPAERTQPPRGRLVTRAVVAGGVARAGA